MYGATEEQKQQIKELIQDYFHFARVSPTFDGEINDKVAEVFGIMLEETSKCSTVFKLVPGPTGLKPGIVWLATQVAQGAFRNMFSQISVTCARGVIFKFRRSLEMAAMGVALHHRSVSKWA